MHIRRVSVSFPDDHQVWKYPKGQQSAKIRELVDMALRLDDELRGIKQELQLIRNGSFGKMEEPGEKTTETSGFDVSDFIQNFED